MVSIEYLAGHFDGEGCILMRPRYDPVNRDSRFRLGISVANAYYPVLELYKTRFEGTITKGYKYTNKTVFHWKLDKMIQCKYFLETITPYLLEKKAQANIALEYLQERLKYSLHGHIGMINEQHYLDNLSFIAYKNLKALKGTVNLPMVSTLPG